MNRSVRSQALAQAASVAASSTTCQVVSAGPGGRAVDPVRLEQDLEARQVERGEAVLDRGAGAGVDVGQHVGGRGERGERDRVGVEGRGADGVRPRHAGEHAGPAVRAAHQVTPGGVVAGRRDHFVRRVG
ncbi:hypothetical protein GCM10020001_053760 [Nonomuraea salmonea]